MIKRQARSGEQPMTEANRLWREAIAAATKSEKPEQLRSYGGRRADLDNRFFRSRMEANYARYLKWLLSIGEIRAWDYECDEWEFKQVKRGNRFYKCDFKVTEKDGRVVYHECKGFMDNDSRVKLDRMRQYYPQITIIVIDNDQYQAIARKVKHIVPGWETGEEE